MKYSTILSALAAGAAAAPLEARDGPHGAHGGMAGMAGMTPPAKPAAPGGLAGLIPAGFDMSSIGKLLQGGGMADIGKFVNPQMMKQYGGLMSAFLQKQKAFKIEELKPLLRPEAKRVKIIYGPYKLKGTETTAKVGNGFSFDPSGTGYMYMLDTDFPRDITIIDVKSGVTDEAYVPIDIGKGLYNHHNVFYDLSTAPTTITGCKSSNASYTIPINIFMGGATESSGYPYTSADGKFNSGFYLGKDAKIVNMVDVVNYNKGEKTVYVVSEMEYVPGKVADSLPASSQVIDIGMCSGQTGLFVHPPEGKKQWTLTSADIDIIADGYILNSKAHMHDGGVNMVALLNGKEVCDSKAIYGGEGREGTNADGTHWSGLAGTSICEKVIPVKKGDTIKFVANFDTAAHPEREQHGGGDEHGEMGMAEGMALFTASFALEIPGGKPNYIV